MIDMLAAHQVRLARLSVGPSTARNQGGPGVVRKAREYLATLELRRFSTANAGRYRQALDEATEELTKAMRPKGATWGLARKVLNIFIRDAAYHVLLNSEFRLDRACSAMELPLDSLTAKALKDAVGRGRLPPWPGVKHLKIDVSDRFQAEAAHIAKAMGIVRVDLDVLWWGVRDEDDAGGPKLRGPRARHGS